MLSEYELIGATIRNFRSIGLMSLRWQQGKVLMICGPNNVGKTNVLRALDLFFSLDYRRFLDSRDLPHHVYDGSRGAGAKTTIAVEFRETATGRKVVIRATFRNDEDLGNAIDLYGVCNRQKLDHIHMVSIIRSFRFIFVEASNINLPSIVSSTFVNDILPGMDSVKRRGQTKTLQILSSFFDEAYKAVGVLEGALTTNIESLLCRVPGFETKQWKAKVVFPEFDTLREAISGQIDFTLKDSNDRSLEAKGSGIQRIVLLAVMKYVASTSKESCIWAIDEPEAFLQPGLQRAVADELRALAQQMPVIVTTHSPHFVDMNDLDTTLLLGSTEHEKVYKRRPGRVFLQTDTFVDSRGGMQKLQAIREHFGFRKNDAWNILPYNILVEGEEDKHYLTVLGDRLGISLPNILVAGGADKIPSLLEFIGEFCEDMSFKPYIMCLLDHDPKGREVHDKLKSKESIAKLPYMLSRHFVVRADGVSNGKLNYEIEDWVYPELMLKAVNAFLRKKGYDKIPDSQLKLRWNLGYSEQSILAFFTEIAKGRNPNEAPMHFEAQAIKYWLCEHVCEQIRRLSDEELAALDAAYPHTRPLLEALSPK